MQIRAGGPQTAPFADGLAPAPGLDEWPAVGQCSTTALQGEQIHGFAGVLAKLTWVQVLRGCVLHGCLYCQVSERSAHAAHCLTHVKGGSGRFLEA